MEIRKFKPYGQWVWGEYDLNCTKEVIYFGIKHLI